jgi:hypothetical protein
MRKIWSLALGVALLTLTSCVGIESRLDIRGDGSGTLSLTYRISRRFAQLGRNEGEPLVVPVPVSREDFVRALAGADGVALKAFRRTQDEKDVTIRADLAFSSLEALSRLEAFREMDARISTSGSLHTFSQVITKAAAEPVTEDSQRMLDDLFDGYDLAYTVTAPGPIQSSSPGTVLSADRRTLTFKTSIRNLVSRTEDLVLSLSW